MHISCTPVMRGGECDGPNIGRAGGIRQYHCIDLDGASANLKRTAMDRLAAGSTYRYMAPHLLDIVKHVGTGAKRGRWQKRMLCTGDCMADIATLTELIKPAVKSLGFYLFHVILFGGAG